MVTVPPERLDHNIARSQAVYEYLAVSVEKCQGSENILIFMNWMTSLLPYITPWITAEEANIQLSEIIIQVGRDGQVADFARCMTQNNIRKEHRLMLLKVARQVRSHDFFDCWSRSRLIIIELLQINTRCSVIHTDLHHVSSSASNWSTCLHMLPFFSSLDQWSGSLQWNRRRRFRLNLNEPVAGMGHPWKQASRLWAATNFRINK